MLKRIAQQLLDGTLRILHEGSRRNDENMYEERDLYIDCEDGFKDENGWCVEDNGLDMSHKLVQCPAEDKFDNCNICTEANVQVGENWLTYASVKTRTPAEYGMITGLYLPAVKDRNL